MSPLSGMTLRKSSMHYFFEKDVVYFDFILMVFTLVFFTEGRGRTAGAESRRHS